MVKYNEGKYVCKLSPELQKRALEELNEEPARREEAIEILRQWLNKQPHIKGRTDDAFLLKFLRVSKFSIERAKQRLDMFYTMRNAIPEWFQTIDINEPKYQKLIKLGIILPLGYDKAGRRVILGRFGAYDPSEYKLDEVFRISNVINELIYWDDQTQICGSVFVNDMTGMSGGHMAQLTPFVAKKMMACWQDSMPIRIKGLNYINTPSFFETAFSMIKVFMKEKLQRRVKVHGSKLESLHAEIPREILPTELGGTAGDIATIAVNLVNEINDNRQFFIEEAKYKLDESKRPGKPKTQEDLFGIDGTFRKLNID
ncbi:hypothetical protein CHUAL_009874 [Chamberlinius hualienensis]